MKINMPRGAWSGSAGKKYIIIASILILSSGCVKQAVAPTQPVQPVFDGRLEIDSPKEGDTVGQTFTISGKAQDWFEGTVPVSVYDTRGNELFMTSVSLNADNYGKPVTFTKSIALAKQPETPSGWVEFTDHSQKDNSVVYLRVVNIKFKNFQQGSQDASSTAISLPLQYNNAQYGFTFGLPEDWKGYSVSEQSWEGWYVGHNSTAETIKGPEIHIINPKETATEHYQQIPVMVFTLQQWNDVQSGQLSASAAPFPPSELGRNVKYVFALPPRYNYAFLSGYEEVEQIFQSNPLSAY